MPTILVVEDEPSISDILVDNLRFEGYTVLAAADGLKGLELALTESIDLILLDLMLPGLNGYEICRRIRERGLATPVIMLTARGQESDKVLGLGIGADDYVTKPVGILELVARIKAVLRRTRAPDPPCAQELLLLGQAQVDFARRQATVEGRPVHLSPKAFGILRLLWERAGKAVSRAEILQLVWGYDRYPTTRTVDTHIAELRSHLEPDPAHPRYILTVHGLGYRLDL